MLAATLAAATEGRGALWVAPTGNDANPGSAEQPLRSVEGARRKVREINRSMTDDITVFIAGGLYPLDQPLEFGPDDSGMNGFNVIYTAAPGQHPVLSGGHRIRGWKLVDPSKNLWSASAGQGSAEIPRHIYLDGIRSDRTRGSAPMELVIAQGGHIPASAGLSHWRNPTDLEFVFDGGERIWSERTGQPHLDGEFRWPVASAAGPTITLATAWWSERATWVPDAIENAYELLANPGEAYFDRGSRMVYYIPRHGEDIAAADVEIPGIDAFIIGSGLAGHPLTNVVFKGLTMQYAGCPGLPTEPGGAPRANVRISESVGIQFLDDFWVHLEGSAVAFYSGAEGETVEGCTFSDVAGFAISVGDAASSETPLAAGDSHTPVVSDNRISNNRMGSVAEEFRGCAAIEIQGGRRTLIANNRIEHLPGPGIRIRGYSRRLPGSNVIARNVIEDTMAFDFDKGGIVLEGLGDPREAEATLIAGNVLSRQFGPGHAIDLKGWTGDATLTGNAAVDGVFDAWGRDGPATTASVRVRGNYWLQPDLPQRSTLAGSSGNHSAASRNEVPQSLLAAAGPEASYRAVGNEAMPRTIPPRTPQGVSASAGDGCAYVAWCPDASDGGSAVSGFVVSSSAGDRTILPAAEFQRSAYARVGGLTNGRTYTFTVTAINAAGTGASSLPTRPVTPDSARKRRLRVASPPAIEGLAVGPGCVSLNWSAPASDGGSPVLAYYININPGGRRIVVEGRRVLTLGIGGDARSTSTRIDSLPAGTCQLSIVAVNSVGTGAPAYATLTIPPFTSPPP